MSAVRDAAAPRSLGRLTLTLLAAAVVVAGAVVVATSPEGHGRVAAPAAPAEWVVLSVSGTGPASPAAFSTGQDWALRFSFTCAGGEAAAFRVVERGGDADGVALADRWGSAGRGTMYVHADPAAHRVEVETGCRWALLVTDGAALPSAAS